MLTNRKNTERTALFILVGGLFTALSLVTLNTSGQTKVDAQQLFATSDQCQSCHNNIGVQNGEDISMGTKWQGTMMAHAAVDPYWLAAVRREITDHPEASAAIQDECSKCHKPMQRFFNHQIGQKGLVFDDDTANRDTIAIGPYEPFSLDGVSCTVCHQIEGDNLGTKDSFVGGFEFDITAQSGTRNIHGPYAVANGTKRIMSSSTGFEPGEKDHIQSSEFCATCHTLYTHSLDKQGNVLGEFPEQVPYIEWQHSSYDTGNSDSTTCQDCHMATLAIPTPISSVLGKPREEFSLHSFRGGNFLLLQLMADNSEQVGARTGADSLELSVRKTKDHLRSAAATISIDAKRSALNGTDLHIELAVQNLAGHKLPTAYPSRRVWIQLTVQDGFNKTVFDSGALESDGSIAKNDNDLDPEKFESHYKQISDQDQVQIYEAIMGQPNGEVTTGLLEATKYLKDNRILPMGFDKKTADADVAVRGLAMDDENFADAQDLVKYLVSVNPSSGPFKVRARLWYQPVGFRWANNLAEYEEEEPQAFVKMYKAIPGSDTACLLAEDTMAITAQPVPVAEIPERVNP